MTGTLQRGRELFDRRQWGDAVEALATAATADGLDIDDLERLGAAGHLCGRFTESLEAWTRAHQACLQEDDLPRAARCAFWIWMGHTTTGDMAHASGWVSRARTILDDNGQDCVEQGYLRMPTAVQAMYSGQITTAYASFLEVAEIADRYADVDLQTLSRMGRGQCLVFMGRTAAGIALLDEVMIAVTTGDVTPAIVGLAYCAVIDACHGVFDVQRAQEWTVALSRWCETQPDLVPYRGQCLVHRAELMQLHGAWPDAIAEAERAQQWLSQPPPQPSVGAACYRLGELHRLRGEQDRAEESYREASRWGHPAQPGLALLRLARGDVAGAAGAIRVALDQAEDPGARCSVLPAYVEILLAADEIAAARTAADDLRAIADQIDAPLLVALAAHAHAAVCLEESDPRQALTALRRAWAVWRDLEAPYEGARARVLMSVAFRLLGDEDSAEMELDAARWVFQDLQAAPDLARIEALRAGVRAAKQVPAATGHGLTGREVELLTHLATGKTNRAIATDLVISEKTVARHVANIFMKLGVSTRAAATAYAYEHELV